MRRPLLLAALFVGLTGYAGSAQADPGHHHRGLLVYPQSDDDIRFEKPYWPYAGFLPGHDHPGPWWRETTPWHYHPHGPCVPPWCLPSYHRHRGFLTRSHVLPLELVLERLKGLDYYGFGRVLLAGANYSIEAHSRYGRPVRLIVDADTGLIRRVLQ